MKIDQKIDGDSGAVYNSSTLDIKRDRYYSSDASLKYLYPFIITTYCSIGTNVIKQIISEYNANKTIKRIYPTITDDSTMIDYLPLATKYDEYPEVGLSKTYSSDQISDIINKYQQIRFTVYDDCKIQGDIAKYYAKGSDTFLYDNSSQKKLINTYRWAIMTKHISGEDNLLCIPFIKKIDYTTDIDTHANLIKKNITRYYLNYKLNNSGILSENYTDFINSSYKGNGDSPILKSTLGTQNYAIPIQLCYRKFTEVGPIGYDASYSSCYDDIISSSDGKTIGATIDASYENRNRVIADSIPPYKLYSIFFYNRTLYIQEDYYTKNTILHDSIKNSGITMSQIMQYYYPPLLNKYGTAVKLASNLPENKLYILINGQGGGGAYTSSDHGDKNEDVVKTANGGNAGNSSSLILIMKDTYGTNESYSSETYPQCIIKIPTCPTQSISTIADNIEYNGKGGTRYNCEILYGNGHKYVIAYGKGGASEDNQSINSNDNNYEEDYNSDDGTPDWAAVTTLGRIYNIEDCVCSNIKSTNGHYKIPFRLAEYTSTSNDYDNNKNFNTTRTIKSIKEDLYCAGHDIYSEHKYGLSASKTQRIIACGGSPSIFARGGYSSNVTHIQTSTFPQAGTQDSTNINGSYGSGGGGYSSNITFAGNPQRPYVAGAGGAAAFTIGWYNTEY